MLVKSLLLPKLTHVLTSLPKPALDFTKRLRTEMFHFIWGGKTDRLRRLSICRPYDKGGLAMVEIDTWIDALKATWIRREIKSNHSWTSLFQYSIAKGRFFWEMNGSSLTLFSNNISNLFWVEVFRAFASLSKAIEINVHDLNRCGLWFSDMTRNTNTCNKAWLRKGMKYISDIIDSRGEILSFQEAKQSFGITGSFLDYVGLTRSLPDSLRSGTKKARAEYPIMHPQIETDLRKEKGAKYLYDIMLSKQTKSLKNTWEKMWETMYGDINWPEVYRSIYNDTSVYYHVLSYKVITQIVATNRILYQMGLHDSPICSRCRVGIETIKHKFWECRFVREFWNSIETFIDDLDVITGEVRLCPKKVFLGVPNDSVMNLVISIGKSLIAKQGNLNINQFVRRLTVELWGSMNRALEWL